MADEYICDFGLHAGEPYSKLPACFLNWMIETNHSKQNIAKLELGRRAQAVYDSRAQTNSETL
ncbi:hypothetical protein [Pseudoalteromonas luteoviolacea]|uniref:Uncharacterized protein n=1 Tax=Pseudoalteromonas luteoviolacea DSM 6061 TaxID=1365250 RepID=A0A161ZYI3_9GAMM|nr:hypothetical protein [Pseudoalteromonas luteoviolacea]KZN39085.1 hypothetical protein N475_14840 [Pseudoalteromonas luteoviolacea DSM 6061]KZN56948.1 hypothetical protein N474_10020 [Pseudoalteromonas luteoviolacea CPMOR-2]MBE0389977.1 hypothetical protein [Pseudoalteromonas luteoviolacea DSM 6061]TQF67477.1 hypothetical protein FLM44_20030 [Pseudoalteromonas luteoviolacea]